MEGAATELRLLVLGYDADSDRERRARERSGIVDPEDRELRRAEKAGELAYRRMHSPCAWWLPYGCRRASAVLVGGVRQGATCGARGCLWCHRRKLEQHVAPANLLPVPEGEVARALRFTPEGGRVITREDVRQFLRRIRAMFREWQQEHGLGAAWWVAEVVEKADEGYSEIPCPRSVKPEDRWLWKFDRETREIVEELHLRCDLEQFLDPEERCDLCHGTGYLPLVHLHVHAVVHARPFWYGDDTRPDDAERFHTFRNGEGFAGFYRRHGLGNSFAEAIRCEAGSVAYIAKAACQYMAKLDPEGRRQVDHDGSQRSAELAAAVYGTERHRGKHGRAYGLRLRQRDAGRVDGFCAGEAPLGECGPARARQGPGGVKRAEERRRAAQKARAMTRERGLGPEVQPSQLVQLLGVGVRAAEALGLVLDGGGEGTSVPKETQVAREGRGGRVSEHGATAEELASSVVIVDDHGPRAAQRLAGGAVAQAWRGVSVVGAADWWFRWVQAGLLVGRGDVCTLLPLELEDGRARDRVRERYLPEIERRLEVLSDGWCPWAGAIDPVLMERAGKALALIREGGQLPELTGHQWEAWAVEIVELAKRLRMEAAWGRDLARHADAPERMVRACGGVPGDRLPEATEAGDDTAPVWRGGGASHVDCWTVALRRDWDPEAFAEAEVLDGVEAPDPDEAARWRAFGDAEREKMARQILQALGL